MSKDQQRAAFEAWKTQSGNWVYVEIDSDALEIFKAGYRAALQSQDRAEPGEPPPQQVCKMCQGNGEIVTDWDRYKNPRQGDIGDEAVAECPDCDGTGKVESDVVRRAEGE